MQITNKKANNQAINILIFFWNRLKKLSCFVTGEGIEINPFAIPYKQKNQPNNAALAGKYLSSSTEFVITTYVKKNASNVARIINVCLNG